MTAATRRLTRALFGPDAHFGRGPILAVGAVVIVGLTLSLMVFGLIDVAAPTHLTITAGPPGSAFLKNAEQYKTLLAKQGVTLKILPSQGSQDNLQKLAQPKEPVDVGFVLAGEASSTTATNLMSLGSVSYQPLMVFYRGPVKRLLSDFKGARLDIGPAGSGSSILAQSLLTANGIAPGDGTTYAGTTAEQAAGELEAGRIDAFFAMSESTPTEVIRRLLRSPDVHLFNFEQAEGYTRRFPYLNRLRLPRGSLDFGEDIPSEDVQLIAPTVELVARDTLHPALSDVLLEAAREVHGKPGLLRTRGEFPAPMDYEYRISPDATRYYASGKSFLYRTFPFWAASLIARVVAVVVPLALVLIPGLRLVPAVYRWRMTSRIYRWYGALQRLERDALDPATDPQRRQELARQLDHIDRTVARIVVPPAFGDLFYGLRGHITDVRHSLQGKQALTAGGGADDTVARAG